MKKFSAYPMSNVRNFHFLCKNEILFLNDDEKYSIP